MFGANLLPALVEEMTSLARVAAGAEPAGLSDDGLCAAVVQLSRAEALLSAAKGHLLVELDARRVTDERFGMPTAPWLAREASLPKVVARREVNVARRLHDRFDKLDRAVIDGSISPHHAVAVVDATNPRVEHLVEGLQSELISDAADATFEQWKLTMRSTIELLDQDGGYDPARDLDANELTVSPYGDHKVHVNGTVYGPDALALAEAIDGRADELFHQYKRDHELTADIAIPPRKVLRALALVELCIEGRAVDKRTSTPPRPEVTLVVNAERPDVAHTSEGVRLQQGDTWRLLCDAAWRAVVIDSLGVPLDLGREIRFATKAQRRALAVRDGGCVFPGCDEPAEWTDAHHVDHFEDGGTTDLANLASLGRRHHGVVHRKGWKMHATDDGWFWFETPSGQTFWSQRHGRRRTGPTPQPP